MSTLPAPRPLPSDETLAEYMHRRLAGVRCFQLFVLEIGRDGEIYASAKCRDLRNHVVECKAVGTNLADALAKLFLNADIATAPEGPTT